MRIHTEYISFKNHWTISSSYKFQAHQQSSQRRCYFPQTALQSFEVLPGLLSALQHVLKLFTIMPMVLLYQALEIPVTLKAIRNALLQSDTLLKLTLLSLHFISPDVLPEAPTAKNTYCWCHSLYQNAWHSAEISKKSSKVLPASSAPQIASCVTRSYYKPHRYALVLSTDTGDQYSTTEPMVRSQWNYMKSSTWC